MLLKKLSEITPQKFFLVVALCFGIFYVFLTPVFLGPDEPSHFLTISRYANGYISPSTEENMVGVRTNKGALELYERFFPNLSANPKSTGLNQLPKLLDIKLGDFRGEFSPFLTSTYTPFSYIQFIPVYFLTALLRINPFIIFIILRLSGLLIWAGLVYLSIKVIPRGKWLFTTFALLPMSLFVGTIVGADSLVFGLVYLSVALIVNGIVNPKVLTKNYIFVLLSTVLLLGATKQTFFLTSLLLFAIPRTTFLNKRIWYLIVSLIFILTAGFSIAWQLYFNKYIAIPIEFIDVNPQAQVANILEHPYLFGKSIFNTYLTTNSSQVYLGIIGVLGWQNISLPIWITGGWLVMLISAIKTSPRKIKIMLSKFQISIFLLVALALTGMLTLALYLVWTPVGAEFVRGLQGRYFLPIIVVLLPFIIINREEPNRHTLRFIVFGIVFLQVSTVLVYLAKYIQIL